MTRRTPIALLLSTTIALAGARAQAAPEDDAKDLFQKGRDARKRGDCVGAIPLFEKASVLFPTGLGSLRNLAECEEAVGRWSSAKRHWLDLKRAALLAKDAKYAGWDADADAAVARLSPKIARLVVDVVRSDGVAILDATKLAITLDGEPFDPRLLGTPLDRDPGRHVVRVEGGKVPVEQSVDVEAGAQRSVRLAIEIETQTSPVPEPTPATDISPKVAASEPPRKSAPPPIDPRPSDVSDSNATRRTLGWIGVGVGGVAVIGTAVALGVRESALSTVHDRCASGACPDTAENRATVSRGRTASTLVDVFGAVAIVGLGVGVGLVLTSPAPKGDHAGVAVRVAPWASAAGGGAVIAGSF